MADFVEICNVCTRKVIIKAAKRIFNSDKIWCSYYDFYFGVTFLEHSVVQRNVVRATKLSNSTNCLLLDCYWTWTGHVNDIVWLWIDYLCDTIYCTLCQRGGTLTGKTGLVLLSSHQEQLSDAAVVNKAYSRSWPWTIIFRYINIVDILLLRYWLIECYRIGNLNIDFSDIVIRLILCLRVDPVMPRTVTKNLVTTKFNSIID